MTQQRDVSRQATKALATGDTYGHPTSQTVIQESDQAQQFLEAMASFPPGSMPGPQLV
jgi:hypothetical protein